jgi:MICAL-like protein 1
MIKSVEKDPVQLRRKLSIDPNLQSTDNVVNVKVEGIHQSELEKDKDEKEISNLNLRFSTEVSLANDDEASNSSALNKSTDGRWKRRKDRAAPIPGFAQPQRRILQMLPMQDIRQELEKIEVQQQGLEKQGVTLEKMIRERCEGVDDNRTTEELLEEKEKGIPSKNPKDVEELILQLFELVNEKNELFRRQAELMYLRREHRLEEEQADVEFEIRKLLGQPESNKTDHDKAREEALIQRLVEIVALRDEIVNCLDRDRLREFEEDKVIIINEF